LLRRFCECRCGEKIALFKLTLDRTAERLNLFRADGIFPLLALEGSLHDSHAHLELTMAIDSAITRFPSYHNLLKPVASQQKACKFFELSRAEIKEFLENVRLEGRQIVIHGLFKIRCRRFLSRRRRLQTGCGT
jgi:hypothetical protein